MTEFTDFKKTVTQQKQFFSSGKTLSFEFRVEQLKKLKTLIQTHQDDIFIALKKDLNKPPLEALTNESVLKKTFLGKINPQYPPYSEKKFQRMKWLLKWWQG